MSDARTVAEQLAAPFPADVIHWKPQATSKDKTKALAVGYLNARDIMDRLDAVVGVAFWEDHYEELANGCVKCKLAVRFPDGTLALKEDVGSPSEQSDPGDRLKAAFSDAFKRVAVKFGIGRYLYRLPHQWVAYDDTKKRFTAQPTLPAWALPLSPAGKPERPATSPPGASSGAVADPNAQAKPASTSNGRITPAQAEELDRLRKEHPNRNGSVIDWARFCVHYQLQRETSELPAEHYEDAKRQIVNLDSPLHKPMQPSEFALWVHKWDWRLEKAGCLAAGEFQDKIREVGKKMKEKSDDFVEWRPTSIPGATQAALVLIEEYKKRKAA